MQNHTLLPQRRETPLLAPVKDTTASEAQGHTAVARHGYCQWHQSLPESVQKVLDCPDNTAPASVVLALHLSGEPSTPHHALPVSAWRADDGWLRWRMCTAGLSPPEHSVGPLQHGWP
jgi:hypothetical protein